MARVLVVDDDSDVRSGVALRLQRDGHTAVECPDGPSALQFLTGAGSAGADAAVDLVVLDLVMPFMDGYELLDRLTRDPRTSALPVLVLSGRDGPEGIVRALRAGAADYVLKPFHARELVARVELALRRDAAAASMRRVGSLVHRLGSMPPDERVGLVHGLLASADPPPEPLRSLLALLVPAPHLPVD